MLYYIKDFDAIKRGFIFCLLGSDRPILESLNPNFNDHLTPTDKAFLLGFEDGTPDWDASEYRDFLHYPSVQWKLLNIRKLKEKNPQKHKDSISKLQKYLAL
ncbi:Uncharacterised protein [Alistipes finegoldii]|nr:Uncharacterised protein [Alistipes finegoldii]